MRPESFTTRPGPQLFVDRKTALRFTREAIVVQIIFLQAVCIRKLFTFVLNMLLEKQDGDNKTKLKFVRRNDLPLP